MSLLKELCLFVFWILDQVYEFVQLAELYYAGSHGMDIVGPAKSSDGIRVKGTIARDKKVPTLMIL